MSLSAARKKPLPDEAPLLLRLGAAQRRIAVMRALQVGDLLCAVPALRALRQAAPQARITLIGLPWAIDFAGRFPGYLDDFIPFPGFPGLPERTPDLNALPAFFRTVRARGFDLVLQMHGSGLRTNHIAAAFGARLLAGFRPATTHAPANSFLLPYPEHGHEIHRLLQLTVALGAQDRREELEFPLLERDRQALEHYPHLAALKPGGYLCVHPGARDPSRRWPPACFAAVADALGRRYGLPVLLTGSQAEREVTSQVRARMSGAAVDAALPLPLGGLAALLAGAALVVTNDTGISHLVAALQVPSVVVFLASSPQRWAPLNGRRHRWIWDPDGRRVADAVGLGGELLEQR